MKLYFLLTLTLAGFLQLRAADATPETKPAEPAKASEEEISYALGVNFGNNLRQQGVEVKYDQILKGIQDGQGNKATLDDKRMREIFAQLRGQITARQEEKKKENKAAGEKFLTENATKEGVVKLPSGLQYKIIQPGTGDSPSTNDEVSVKYTGKLIDGTVFDSTDRRGGAPTKFRVTGVIKGWTEALLKMKKGAVWELAIPADLAYGDAQRPNIPGGSTLLFNVELVDIHAVVPPPAPPTGLNTQPVTSDIIKVPSADDLKKGAKIEVLKPEDVEKEIAKEKARKEAEAKPKK